jgi:AcrR family transcriptional regulator
MSGVPLAAGRAPGRPRDERADRAILDAALELLAEVGPTGLSVEEVAARAGVSKATIYRRFPTKDDLVVASLSCLVVNVPDDLPAGTVQERLVALMRLWWETYAVSPNGVVFHRVLAHAKSNPRLFEAFYDEVIEPRRAMFRSVLRDAMASGELRPDADVELIITLIIGTSIYTNQTRSAGRDPAPGAGPQQLVDAVLASYLRG